MVDLRVTSLFPDMTGSTSGLIRGHNPTDSEVMKDLHFLDIAAVLLGACSNVMGREILTLSVTVSS